MYLWIVIVGGAFAFFSSMGIGANDAANAFATSVGSKALTIRQAVFLAVIFETLGAILMGNHVTNTIRKGIADYKCFEDNPYVLMYGCMWVIFSVGAWLFLASYYEMPVSTTHSCVGGMIGMAVVLGGSNCVVWYKQIDTFPYIGGVGGIVMSWFLSPVFSGIIASVVFWFTRKFVLRHPFESKRINISYPILIGSTMTINTFFIIYKGAKGLGLNNTPIEVAFAIAFGIGIFSAIIIIPIIPKIKNYVLNRNRNRDRNQNINKNNVQAEKTLSDKDTEKDPEKDPEIDREIDPEKDIELTSVELEIRTSQNKLNIKSDKELNRVIELHKNAEMFNVNTEEVFKYLQVFTAICDSFSHGANDVANAIGPFVTIYTIYNSNGVLENKNDMTDDAYWILGLGGVGIGLGLLIYGYKITYAIGEKLCKITPSRGVAIELSSALVIITGSRLKIPLSTTHCQVGATIGVGLLENPKKCSGVNCNVLLKTAMGWLITCFVVAVTAGIFISVGVYSPPLNLASNCTALNITN